MRYLVPLPVCLLMYLLRFCSQCEVVLTLVPSDSVQKFAAIEIVPSAVLSERAESLLSQ